jgi:hypothetical protein
MSTVQEANRTCPLELLAELTQEAIEAAADASRQLQVERHVAVRGPWALPQSGVFTVRGGGQFMCECVKLAGAMQCIK